MRLRNLPRLAALLSAATLVVVALTTGSQSAHSSTLAVHLRDRPAVQGATNDPVLRAKGIHKIKHIVIIMQENRSFDNYFGTYKGADGIPGLAGNSGSVPCLRDPANPPNCVKPYHDRYDFNYGGPYYLTAATTDIDGGKMDGFINTEEQWFAGVCKCSNSTPPFDVMGYHTRKDIPNYWKYADNFVLQDHMFGSVPSWSLPSHLYLTSEWSAVCAKNNDPASCTNEVDNPNPPPGWGGATANPKYAWTDLTYLLHKHHVSWRYYMFNGTEPPCDSDATLKCTPGAHGSTSLPIWYPIKWFDTVKKDKQSNYVQSVNGLFSAARKGTLPSVSWVVPSGKVSEHGDQALVSTGQTYVTGVINALMQSPDWKSTAIFLSWDDWGGFYDNMNPPVASENGYGFRVPGLVISPYAKKGYIDHQGLSFDAYAKFIEDDFLGGQALDPATDGRPDPRPVVPEALPTLGNLVKDFNFKQTPRKALILSVHPKTDLTPSSSLFHPNPRSGWG